MGGGRYSVRRNTGVCSYCWLHNAIFNYIYTLLLHFNEALQTVRRSHDRTPLVVCLVAIPVRNDNYSTAV